MPSMKKKLCEFCQSTIITADQRWGMHHSKYAALRDSAHNGCTLCAQLCEDISISRTDPESLAWPLYRWDIRNPQRYGRSEEVFAAIVFRQAVSLRSHLRSQDDINMDLPERTFFLLQQSDPALMQPTDPLGEETFSIQTQQKIRRWLKDCDRTHPDCQGHGRRADGKFVPTRLLDVSHEDRIYVVESRVSEINEPYMTLSYSWGKLQFIHLTQENKERLVREGLALKHLAHTIREAAQITKALGLRYLWVDSLCIIQGPKGDFKSEAVCMLQVYRNSFCNLAAADSTGAEGGIIRKRDPMKLFDAECQGRPNSAIFGNSIWRIVPKSLWDEEVLNAALNTRGWVFQERLLSPRLLHFTKNQVFWDCATMSACETFPDGLPQPLDTGSNDRYWRWKLQDSSDLNEFLPTIVDDSLERFWRKAIRRYTSCSLTNTRDKLIAIWGIARFLIGALKETYGVGLWERNLEEQLAWRVVGCQQGNGEPSERSMPLRAPTWSWASIDGIVDLPDRFAAVRDYQVVSHDEKQIAFKLFGESLSRVLDTNGPRTWTEQLKEYELRLKELDERRQMPVQNRPRVPHEHLEYGAVPHLAQEWIPIWGHIGAAYLRQVRLEAEWALDLPCLPTNSAVIEAFPDLHPIEEPETRTLFLILAMNIIHSTGRREYKGHLQNLAEKYSGVGILVEPAEFPGQFYRTGAFRFSGVEFKAFRTAFITDSRELGFEGKYDEEKGHKIWLV